MWLAGNLRTANPWRKVPSARRVLIIDSQMPTSICRRPLWGKADMARISQYVR